MGWQSSFCRRQGILAISWKIKYTLNTQFRNPHSKVSTQENQNTCPHKASYTNVCCSVAKSCPTLCNLREMQHVRLPSPQVFISALFIIAKNKKGKQPNFKCISISTEWNITESKKKKKDWTTHTQNSMDKSQKYTQSGRKCESVSCSIMSDSLPLSGL